ncbi:MAG: carboxypeptidase-like regulatory domain-containing protein [Pirellulaceae bacterium]
MTVLRIVKTTAVVLACLTWVLPVHELCAAPPLASASVDPSLSPATSPIHDVVLGPGGRLAGQVLDPQGRPLKDQAVLILGHNAPPKRVISDTQGRFAISGLHAGVYQVATDTAVIQCRCWAAGTAPPVAQEEVLLVANSSIERGQRPFGEILANPLLIGLIIAAAIAIPIAVRNSKKSAS